MGVVHSPESNYSRELARWNTPKSQGGMRPDGYEPFPKMLYRAKRREDGVVRVIDHTDPNHTRQCKLVVRSESELEKAKRDGWRESQAEALAAFERAERLKADEAAHRHYDDRNMSERARAEAEAVEAENPLHTPEIPEKRKARRGRRVA